MQKITILLLTFCWFSSCEDDLNLTPISEVGSNGFFSSAGDFQQAVNGVYASLGVSGGGDYPAMYVILDESRSDNIYSPGDAGVRDWNAINNFEPTIATLGSIDRAWNLNFNAIMRANTVLDQLAENAGVIGDADLATHFEAEAKFLRAFFYFDLVKWYGRVPLIETFVSPDEALEIPRAPVEDVYALILSDLEFAMNNLPESYSGSERGRATSLAAKAILARVYLTRSGPELHPDGPCLASGEYDLAAAMLDDIINSNQFAMLDDYGAIFSYTNEGNSEIVWDVQFISGGVGAGGYYPTEYYDEGWARVYLPFPGGNPGDGAKRVSDDLLNSFPEGDLRVEHTFKLNYINDNGEEVDAQFFDKYTDEDMAGGDRFDWSLNYPIMRYTDVLLLRAECTLQGTSGSQADVDAAVNAVRRRAGLEEVSDVDLGKLLEERRREFAGENLRWDDLVRTGTVLEVMNAFIATEDANNKMQTVTVEDIIYPIPQQQLDVKQGLYEQNPGY
ncbi:RagB/SusD domain-containing protein [Neolewinella xylanilytica]|uniref:RagB/SusD domain-containing protein n=1 Tax=Neolewinella xylanilytica TaxID=1514080 RepID=A0A2S6I4A4_9BACT|nr:RagB/SusD family nutrient uptake outer membrane protein [Neolewinella xylanilytica]PPK85891.1 RagB/SusD domain-containing protein [Neolewinella xylanilytica]